MEISNPDKEYFPGVTKRRVVEHYEAAAAAMLPHIVHRPLTLERYPDGVLENGFMQKNASGHFPDFIERVDKALYSAKERGRNRVCVDQ